MYEFSQLLLEISPFSLSARWNPRARCLPDFQIVQSLRVLLNVDVDGKVSVDISHLIFVTLGDAGHQVLNDGLDGSESGDVLSRAMVNLDLNELLAFFALGNGEGNGNV